MSPYGSLAPSPGLSAYAHTQPAYLLAGPQLLASMHRRDIVLIASVAAASRWATVTHRLAPVAAGLKPGWVTLLLQSNLIFSVNVCRQAAVELLSHWVSQPRLAPLAFLGTAVTGLVPILERRSNLYQTKTKFGNVRILKASVVPISKQYWIMCRIIIFAIGILTMFELFSIPQYQYLWILWLFFLFLPNRSFRNLCKCREGVVS